MSMQVWIMIKLSGFPYKPGLCSNCLDVHASLDYDQNVWISVQAWIMIKLSGCPCKSGSWLNCPDFQFCLDISKENFKETDTITWKAALKIIFASLLKMSVLEKLRICSLNSFLLEWAPVKKGSGNQARSHKSYLPFQKAINLLAVISLIHWQSLRKHAYSNTLKILHPKKEDKKNW